MNITRRNFNSQSWWTGAIAAALVMAVWPTVSPAQTTTSTENAGVAREAYEKQDAKPTENWFGCPPRIDDSGQRADAGSNVAPNAAEDLTTAEQHAMANCRPDESGDDKT